MKLIKILVFVTIAHVALISVAVAGDFGWRGDLNKRAHGDLADFRARLAVRFNIGDVQIKAVLSNVDKPADAYIVLRLGEMSEHPLEHVMAEYRSNKGQGWGVVAKSLGIKPGSHEFHALKRGHDLYDNRGNGRGKGKSKSPGKSKGKDKKRK